MTIKKRHIRVHDSAFEGSRTERARYIHEELVGGIVFANALNQIEGLFKNVSLDQCSMAYFEDMLKRIGPRDPVEEMLAVQMILAHARVLHLTHLACRETLLDGIRVLHESRIGRPTPFGGWPVLWTSIGGRGGGRGSRSSR